MLLPSSPTHTDLITLFEYEGTDALSERELKMLYQLSQTLGFEILKPTIRNGTLYVQARQYVGVIRLDRRTVQILPKIHRSCDREHREQEAAQNLLLMLDYAGYLGIREVNLAGFQRFQNWFEVLIYLFTTHLKRQWLRATDRSYQPVNAVLPVLKGKWQIVKQLRRPEQKHLFAVCYDEFTVDTPLNRLFRYVVEGLWRLTQDGDNRQRLSDLRYWMDEVSLLPALAVQEARQIQLNRLNRHYEPLLNLARLFLEGLGLQLSAHNLSSFAFVFDMNQLYEQFMVAFIQRHQKEVLPEALLGSDLLAQGKSSPQYLATYLGRPVFRLRPDLVFRRGSDYPLLIDFKYKQLEESDRRLGIAEADFYQMYAYLKQFDSPRLILMYPQTTTLQSPLRARFTLQDPGQNIYATSINLLQDLTKPHDRKFLKAELKGILGADHD